MNYLVCKICNPTLQGNDYCAKHSTGGSAYKIMTTGENKMTINKLNYWKIKQDLNSNDRMKAIQALIIMMDISISDDKFKSYADQNPDWYKWFEEV